MSRGPGRLRALLARERLLVTPFVFDGLQARLAVEAGFEALYMTGFGTAAAHGLPDIGLLGRAEMVANARTIVRAAGVPVICDADTGYGDAASVWHTVREYEDAGAAGIHLEDQRWPKRCGFLAGKEVVPLAEALGKLGAALEARRDRDFVIIARTDAFHPLGWEEAVRRARAFHEAGADLVFVDGIRTREDLARYAADLHDVPRLYNGLLPPAEVERAGFRVMLHIAPLVAIHRRLRDAYRELAETGSLAGEPGLEGLAPMVASLGFSSFEEIGRRHAPADEASAGAAPREARRGGR